MIYISVEDFKAKIENKESFIVLFHSALCDKCEKQIEMLEKNSIQFVSIECDSNPEQVMTECDVDMIPEIRVYRHGIQLWNKINLTTLDDIEVLKNHAKHL